MNQTVHIWSIPLDQDPRPIVHLLQPDEVARANRFQFARDARRYRVGRALLRRVLSHHTGIAAAALRFHYNAYGKPALAPDQNTGSWEFNLSHSGEHALCAVAQGHAVGIDLEEIHPVDYLAMAKVVFSTLEQATLAQLSQRQQLLAFFQGWTRKEAYIKAWGQGLSMALTDFDVTVTPGQAARLLATRPDPAEARRWSLHGWFPAKQQVAALAVAGERWQLLQHAVAELA